jgi:hypothetical protein
MYSSGNVISCVLLNGRLTIVFMKVAFLLMSQ